MGKPEHIGEWAYPLRDRYLPACATPGRKRHVLVDDDGVLLWRPGSLL